MAVLLLLVMLGLLMAATGASWRTIAQREKERELLFIGDQFRQAIGLYYERTPDGVKVFPKRLQDLLQDNRYPTVQRYLRKVYRDPITNKAEWGLVAAPGGGIMGVYSLSEDAPLKRAGFREADRAFKDQKRYVDWRFVYIPAVAPTTKPFFKPPPPAQK
ncbi:MAG TPA: type II secretion system protein [Burkholderiales bacterium]|nr:type II secretion system protein [Burkholderiales bacterium]